MNWLALLTFCYAVVWKWLGVLAIVLVINLFLSASTLKEIYRRDAISYVFKAQIVNLVAFIYRILLWLWIVIFIVNVGHWIKIY